MNTTKCRQTHCKRPAPIQLPLFADAASLIHVRREFNEWRFYRIKIWPDLFGCALRLRQWGRVGTEGHRRLDPHQAAMPEGRRPSDLIGGFHGSIESAPR